MIYEAVRERDDAVVRARDLHLAFAKSMQADPATGRLILHRVADNHERLANLDANELAHGMTEAWLNRAATTKAFTGFDVGDLWTDWAVWSARQPLVAGLLGEQPLERARDAPKPDHAYWAISWARLWKCATGHPGLISDAETWLQSQEGLQSLHWSFVWEKLFEYKKSRHQDVLSLAAGAADWLRENEFEPDWNFVLRPLAGMVPERVPWKSALRLLDEFPGNRNWAYVFQVVVENATVFDQDHRQTTLRLGWEWSLLTEAQDIAEWNYVWRKLVELRAGMPKETAKALLRAGYKWLQGREERNGWSHVWEKLVEVRAELPEETAKALLWAGYEWLAGREDREDWNYVWQKLVDVRAELPEEAAGLLLPRGYEWLQGREEREDWSHVWQKLVELRGELPEETKSALLRRGYEWLAGREDRAEWTFVWQNLEACGFRSEHEPLEKLAWRWLERPENADRGGWDKIWEICFKNGSRDDEFLSAGSNWVLGHRALPQTIGLASDLLNAARERDGWSPPRELVGLVRNWLAANPLHPSWTFFWGSLWSIDPSRELLNL
ncbi:MAG: hypothetical protein DMG72_18925 [Acidobacteria bacterium]|nr:MAG: hypothetical protein DMG72_18925 [Acidobacteriota bacterium]